MASDLEVTILVSEPLRPVLVLNPLWEKPTATATEIQGFWGCEFKRFLATAVYGDIKCSIASCVVR